MAAGQTTRDRVTEGQGDSKIKLRRERQFSEFLQFETMYAELALATDGKGLRELRAMKEMGLKFLKERHADEWVKAKEDSLDLLVMSKASPKNLPLLQKTNAGNMRNVKNTNVKFTSTGKEGVNQQKTELVCHNPSTLLKM
eukprot:gene2772-7412_t